jgi:hypothetical protein
MPTALDRSMHSPKVSWMGRVFSVKALTKSRPIIGKFLFELKEFPKLVCVHLFK